MPGDSQFPNPNPPRPIGPKPKPPVGTINPVKPGVGKAPSTDGRTTAPMPMKPGIKTKNAPMPYNKNNSKKLGTGY